MNTEGSKRTATMPDPLPLNKFEGRRLSGLPGTNGEEFVGRCVSGCAGELLRPWQSKVIDVASKVVPSTSPQRRYSIDVYAVGRGFNPAGSDAGPLDDGYHNSDSRYTDSSFAIAVVNA